MESCCYPTRHAFTIYGFENFEDSSYPGYNVKPVMMYCGKDAVAKETVGKLIAQLGWDPLDVGGLEQALHLEHMTLLWVHMVRVNGHSPKMVWAMLTRWRTWAPTPWDNPPNNRGGQLTGEVDAG